MINQATQQLFSRIVSGEGQIIADRVSMPTVDSFQDTCNMNIILFIIFVMYMFVDNYALNHSAYQMSVTNEGYASNAVDGNIERAFPHGSCIHTAVESAPWWAVDLGEQVYVTSVYIVSRKGE